MSHILAILLTLGLSGVTTVEAGQPSWLAASPASQADIADLRQLALRQFDCDGSGTLNDQEWTHLVAAMSPVRGTYQWAEPRQAEPTRLASVIAPADEAGADQPPPPPEQAAPGSRAAAVQVDGPRPRPTAWETVRRIGAARRDLR